VLSVSMCSIAVVVGFEFADLFRTCRYLSQKSVMEEGDILGNVARSF
jgi:hypothetical protein